jgi:cytochrome b6-f complex iron-sulfur subunit
MADCDAQLPGGARVTRRRLLDWMLGTSTGALLLSIAYPVVRFLSPPRVPEATTRRVEAGPVNDPELIERGFKIVRFGAEPVILIRVAEDDFRAFSATCTHLDCIVEYQRAERRIWCNCHNGEYDLTGRNVAGPPPRPLERYEVNRVARGPREPADLVVSRS